MDEEKTPESNPQYKKADEKRDKIKLELLQAARETFISLYYPAKNGLMKADFLMEFAGNDYNGEKQIRDVLIKRQKFTETSQARRLEKKCEDQLFKKKWVDRYQRTGGSESAVAVTQ